MLRLTPTKEEAAKSEEIIALLADMSVSSAKFILDHAREEIGTCKEFTFELREHLIACLTQSDRHLIARTKKFVEWWEKRQRSHSNDAMPIANNTTFQWTQVKIK